MLKLAIKGMRGRKKQTWLTLVILTMVIIVVMGSALYSYSSSVGDLQRKKETYGSWQFAYYEETKERVEQLKTNSELEVGVGTQLGKIVSSNFIGDTKIVVGELGSLDQGYLDLRNLKLLSGSFPQKENEIALNSSLLDSLGYSYQSGQTIKINLLANDDLNNTGKIQEYEFTLSGVLFSYDIFWQKGSDNIINAIVAEDTYVKADAKVYQDYFEYLLERIKIKEIVERYPNQISGGQQQRWAIARALMFKPKLIFADEPIGNSIFNLMIDLVHKDKQTIVMVTHDLELVSKANRIITLSDGIILKDNDHDYHRFKVENN